MTPSAPKEPARNITMQDIADIVGVSKAAVSQALAGRGRISKERRLVILETAQKLGFEPDPHARRLSTGSFAITGIGRNYSTLTRRVSRFSSVLPAQRKSQVRLARRKPIITALIF